MREIKFRAWHSKEERWLWFDLNDAISGKLTNNPLRLINKCQYTGLKDENGTPIYEGDIVYLAGYGDYEVKFPFYQLYESSWEDNIGEIKGNIHENKGDK